MTDAHGNKIKKLKPMLIKSKTDREYTQHILSDDSLPAVPEENFTQKREVTMDSYSESISSNDEESSENRAVTVDSDSSATPDFEEVPCKWEANSKKIEATLHQITAGLQSAAEGYLDVSSHMSKVVPYELLQVVAQIPPPLMDAPISISKALLIDGENKAYLIHGEYELNKTSWSKLQKKKYNVSQTKFTLPSKEKEDPEAPSIDKRRRK